MSLKEKAVSGSKWNSIAVVVKAVIQFIQMVLLANILNPEDYGLIGMMSFFIGLSSVLVDMGISGSIMHARNISKSQLSSLFWLNVGIGFLLFIVISICSPLIAAFYSEPKIKELVVLMALGLFANSFTFQHQFLLIKELRFKENAIYGISYRVILLAVSYALALLGFGVYSLIYPNIIVSALAAIFLIYYLRKEYLPKLYFSFLEIKSFLSFSIYQTASNLVSYFNSQVDMLLIGYFVGAEKFGYYYMAKNLAMRPMQIISPIIISVAAPLMAKVNDDILKLKSAYAKVINYISFILFPVYFIILLFANEIITVLYGEKWINSIFSLKILCIVFLIRGLISPIGSLVQATGKAKETFIYNLLLFAVFPLFMYLGNFYGLTGILVTQLIMIIIFYFIHVKMLIRPMVGSITVKEFTGYSNFNFLVNVALFLIAYVLHFVITNQVIWFFTSAFFYAISWLIINYKYNNSFKELLINFKILKS